MAIYKTFTSCECSSTGADRIHEISFLELFPVTTTRQVPRAATCPTVWRVQNYYSRILSEVKRKSKQEALKILQSEYPVSSQMEPSHQAPTSAVDVNIVHIDSFAESCAESGCTAWTFSSFQWKFSASPCLMFLCWVIPWRCHVDGTSLSLTPGRLKEHAYLLTLCVARTPV